MISKLFNLFYLIRFNIYIYIQMIYLYQKVKIYENVS